MCEYTEVEIVDFFFYIFHVAFFFLHFTLLLFHKGANKLPHNRKFTMTGPLYGDTGILSDL